MPTLSKPINIPGPWAYNGDKNTIPDTGADVGLASWAQGWGLVNQLPLTAGGIPPARADFNGALNALSAHVCYQQSGAYYDWSADLMYPFPARVLGSDGKVYDWVSASGAGTSAGAQDPTTDNDRTWWTPAVTGGDLPEFDGTTIKLINGKYGVPFAQQFGVYSAAAMGVVSGDRAVTSGSIDDVTIPGEYSIAITGVDDLPVSLGQVSKMSVYGSAANSGASFAQGTTQILRAIRPNFTGTEIWFRHARDTNVWGPWEQVGGAMPHVQASLHADLTCAAQTETVVPFTADAGDTGNFANGVYTCPRAGLVFAVSLVRAYGMGASVGGASFNLRRDRGAQKGNQAEYNPNYTQTAEVTFWPSPIFALLPVLAGDKIYLSAYFQSQAQLSTANLTSAVDGTHYINTFSLAYLQ